MPASDQNRSHSAETARLIDALREFIPHVMRREHVPGLNIALSLPGQGVWEEGFGYADLARRKPMTKNTVMRSGSMGKTYTATAVMQLVEKGVIGLHRSINEHLDFQIINPRGEREVTPYDLLTHRSGLNVNNANSGFAAPVPLGEHLRRAYARQYNENDDGCSSALWTEKVGERFQYSNLGMATLGYLVERANPDGLSFSEYQQMYIIDPLGMTSTQYPPVPDEAHTRQDIFSEVSTGYAMLGPICIPTPDIYFADFPAGGILTTPGDHIKVLLAYLNGGTYNHYQLLRPDTVRMMLTRQTESATDTGIGSVGLAWILRNHGRPDCYFGHGGAHMYGWHNDFRAYPELGVAIVTAVNQWPMLKVRYTAHNLIADFVASWVQHEWRSETRSPARSWSWKISYVAGLTMAHSILALGMQEALSPRMIEEMAGGVQVAPHGSDRLDWDHDGFRAGVDDALKAGPAPDAIRAFLVSDELQVSPGELELLRRELGAAG